MGIVRSVRWLDGLIANEAYTWGARKKKRFWKNTYRFWSTEIIMKGKIKNFDVHVLVLLFSIFLFEWNASGMGDIITISKRRAAEVLSLAVIYDTNFVKLYIYVHIY